MSNIKSIIVERELSLRKKLNNVINELSLSSGIGHSTLMDYFRWNYCRIISFIKENNHKLHYDCCNIVALNEVLKTCSSKSSGNDVFIFSGNNISNAEMADCYLLYKKHDFSDEEIYSYYPNIVISDEEFHFRFSEKLYIPYESTSSIEGDAFDVNIVLFSKPENPDFRFFNSSILSISIPKNIITPISECYDYFLDVPNPNEIDFWINLYSLEKYRNLFLDGEDKSDKILLKYGFSSYPLEDPKNYYL